MKYEKKTFASVSVPLDDNEYVGCTFNSCTFVYNGGKDFRLADNAISADCGFEFTGPASNTVHAMRAFYGMGDWGRNHILATFQTIAPDLKKLN